MEMNHQMPNFTATEIKQLRDSTGAGMMDAKKALTEADGDFDAALEVLRVKGAAKAAKRGAERTGTTAWWRAQETPWCRCTARPTSSPRTPTSINSPLIWPPSPPV